jgi:hypothetical protein
VTVERRDLMRFTRKASCSAGEAPVTSVASDKDRFDYAQ